MAVRSGTQHDSKTYWLVNPDSFRYLPGAPFAYWVRSREATLYRDGRVLESNGLVARRGVNTNDDYRFLRLWWESEPGEWILHFKGGSWSRFYADPSVVLAWRDRGRELEAEACDVPVRWSCRTGVCHNCESGLISGAVAYEPQPLEKPADGNLLICCSQPIGDIVIDL